MVSMVPWVFLHSAGEHGGGISVLPVAVLVVGVALFAYGAWKLYDPTSARPADAGEEAGDTSAKR